MAKRTKRLIGSICLLLAIILTQVPMPNVFAANGIYDFHMDESTLAKYTGTATVVSVRDDVKVIGEEAFARNEDIGTVTVGKNVKEIDFSAFAGCKYLTSVTLPDSLERIDDYAFSGCTLLSKINIGPNVKSIGSGVFAGCNSLKDITIDEENPHFYYARGALYDDEKETLYGYLNGFPSSNYSMPDSVKYIEKYSFWGNDILETIVFSDYLQEIPGYAFSNCTSLRRVVLPYSVNTIDAKAFENCISLTDVEIPPSVTYIDPTAFDGCIHLNVIAKEGTAGYTFYQDFLKKLEAQKQEEQAIAENQSIFAPGTAETTDQVTTDTENKSATIDASRDPSNVEYMPDHDVLETPEAADVRAKSLVIGGKAVMFLDSKGVTVYESEQNEQSESQSSSSNTGTQVTVGSNATIQIQNDINQGTVIDGSNSSEEVEKPTEQTESKKETTTKPVENKKENVTVVGSIGSVLPQYVSDSLNDEKIRVKSSNSSNRDESPDTGDNSIPVNYVLATGLVAIALMFLLSKNKKAI